MPPSRPGGTGAPCRRGRRRLEGAGRAQPGLGGEARGAAAEGDDLQLRVRQRRAAPVERLVAAEELLVQRADRIVSDAVARELHLDPR